MENNKVHISHISGSAVSFSSDNKPSLIILLLFCAVVAINAKDGETRDLDIDLPEDIDSEDRERKHRKRKKHGQQGQQGGPCGGYGKTFGSHDTFVSAPVMNYFFGCGGVPVAPYVPHFAPVQPYPVQGGYGHEQGHGGYGGHGGHGGGQGNHGGGHGSGHGGGYGGQGGYGGPGFYGGQGYYPQQGFRPGFQPGFNQGFSGQSNRPFQNAFSAAASGIGTALADYISRPRKVQKQINQLLRPIYKLF